MMEEDPVITKGLSKYSPETIVWINFGNIIDEMANRIKSWG